MGRYLQSLNNGNFNGIALKNLEAYTEDIKRRKDYCNREYI